MSRVRLRGMFAQKYLCINNIVIVPLFFLLLLLLICSYCIVDLNKKIPWKLDIYHPGKRFWIFRITCVHAKTLLYLYRIFWRLFFILKRRSSWSQFENTNIWMVYYLLQLQITTVSRQFIVEKNRVCCVSAPREIWICGKKRIKKPPTFNRAA